MLPNNTKSFLLVLAIALTGFLASAAVHADPAAAALTREAQAAITPAEALEMLKQGNERFVSGKNVDRDFLAQVKQTAKGQFPFAAVVSCLDSRIPPAIVFDRGIGDLFVARVAGNFVNDDILGSLGLGFLISSRGSQSWLDPEHASSLQPWKRPRLTPNPAIAFKKGKLFMPFGTPGGDAQCPAMVQMFLNIAEFGMNPQAAIEQPRFIPWNYPNSFWPHTRYSVTIQL